MPGMIKDTTDFVIEDEKQEVTPQNFFDSYKGEIRKDIPELIKKVLDFLEGKKKSVSNFNWSLVSFKYIKEKEGSEEIIVSDEEKVPGLLSTVALILELAMAEFGEKAPTKLGLMVFTIKSDDVFTDDNIKGEDGRVYAFTDLGLESYFSDIKESNVNI